MKISPEVIILFSKYELQAVSVLCCQVIHSDGFLAFSGHTTFMLLCQADRLTPRRPDHFISLPHGRS
jgi:hypothetical protein